MPELRTYNVFISHAWKYHDEYERMVDLLDEASNFHWNNHSVPKEDPVHAGSKAGLTQQLREQIRGTHVVLILGGLYVSHSEWIQTEIEIAIDDYDKPIIGIRPRGSQNIPSAIQEAADEIVGWNTQSVVDAIRRHAR